jgi:hypothetical protein
MYLLYVSSEFALICCHVIRLYVVDPVLTELSYVICSVNVECLPCLLFLTILFLMGAQNGHAVAL